VLVESVSVNSPNIFAFCSYKYYPTFVFNQQVTGINIHRVSGIDVWNEIRNHEVGINNVKTSNLNCRHQQRIGKLPKKGINWWFDLRTLGMNEYDM
jgi:hypothetical protein